MGALYSSALIAPWDKYREVPPLKRMFRYPTLAKWRAFARTRQQPLLRLVVFAHVGVGLKLRSGSEPRANDIEGGSARAPPKPFSAGTF